VSGAPQTRLVALSELRESDLDAWGELADRAAEPNPFLHPDFVLAAARTGQVLSLVHLVIVASTGGWDCCLPVRPTRSWRRLPVPGTIGWRHPQCFLGTPLVSPDALDRSLAALLGDLRDQVPGAFFELDWTDHTGPVGDGIRRLLGRDGFTFGRFGRAALIRRPEATYLDGRLNGKHRRSLRRLANQLSEELGGELALVDRTEEPSAVSKFLKLEASGWKGRADTALASTERGDAFFREMTAGFIARGKLELLFLEAGGHIVAARCNLRAGAVVFCFKVAHDEALRRYSPGTQLELRMIDRFHADSSAGQMDSCTAWNDDLFNRLWPDRRQLGGIVVPRSGVRGLAALPILKVGGAVMNRRRAEGRDRLAGTRANAHRRLS
jgi:CelD/BcsL family acetyltransferase involved in cellulose biosynthesis